MARIIVRDATRGYVVLDCLPYRHKDGVLVEGGKCWFRLRRDGRGADKVGPFWGWDGEVDFPTVSPSIQCLSCGKHVTVIKGVEVL